MATLRHPPSQTLIVQYLPLFPTLRVKPHCNHDCVCRAMQPANHSLSECMRLRSSKHIAKTSVRFLTREWISLCILGGSSAKNEF
ncbi:hypothetical protein GDO86_011510 [Hymenochirus boettgeri]|uniref:Uncharacterized protein n=1 Tax=Hymenochirus boettgeri TaxID=247094 RepID=A0A8T2JGV5_9PIPI|nr:hypothetical protein GDO86_011510 [Hymenochirus boettgeri]